MARIESRNVSQVRGINSVKRALQTFTKPVTLDKDNRYRFSAHNPKVVCCAPLMLVSRCSKCNKLVDAVKSLRVKQAPPVQQTTPNITTALQ